MKLQQKRILKNAVNELLNEEATGLLIIKRKRGNAFLANGKPADIGAAMAAFAEQDDTGVMKGIFLTVAEYFRYKENKKTEESQTENREEKSTEGI